MSDFILQTVLFLSLGAMIFLIGRAVPRLGEEAEPKKISRFFSNLPVHKFDVALAGFLEKNLRKTRVVLLRVDNSVSGFLKKVRSGSGISGVHEKKRHFFSPQDPLRQDENEASEADLIAKDNSLKEETTDRGTEV